MRSACPFLVQAGQELSPDSKYRLIARQSFFNLRERECDLSHRLQGYGLIPARAGLLLALSFAHIVLAGE